MWMSNHTKWAHAFDKQLPMDQPYINVVRSLHLLAMLEGTVANLRGDPTPRFRLWWRHFFGDIVEESCLRESRVPLSSQTSAERHESFENAPSLST